MDRSDDTPAEIVYQRDGLDRPEHRLETALEPGSTYFWSVRLRYRADGQPRASRWSAANVPKFIPPMPIDAKHPGSAHPLTHVRADMYALMHNAAPTAYSSQVVEIAYG